MQSEVESSSLGKKKIIAGSAALLSGALLLIGSMAFFTDRESSSATATAGTVDIALTENWQDVANFNPGDIADLTHSVSNLGNKSVDVRETMVVKSSVAMTDGDQVEFEIYNRADLTQTSGGAYIPNPGAEPVASGADRVLSDDGTYVMYSLDEYVLNGTGAGAETEDGVTETSKEMDYVLLFKDSSKNAFQGADVSVELLTEAKQHRNTDSDDWATIATEDVTIGGESVNAVPQR